MRSRKPFTFRPPKNNALFIWLAKQLALPVMLPLGPRIVSVEVSEGDLGRLRELRGKRVILTPSHSGGKEPYILFHLSKLLGDQ